MEAKAIQTLAANYLVKLDEGKHLSYSTRSLSFLAIKHYVETAQARLIGNGSLDFLAIITELSKIGRILELK